jgi:hypothetical protein
MEINKKIIILKKSIQETDDLVNEIISSLNNQKLKVESKEKKISKLKEEVRSNIDKIDQIIENYNADT